MKFIPTYYDGTNEIRFVPLDQANGATPGFAKIDRASSLTTDDKGNSWIRTIHPYDLANYHWAFSSNGREWTVYRDHGMGENHRRERVGIIVQTDPAGVVSALRELDKSVTSSMDRS